MPLKPSVELVFATALQKESASDRAAYLDSACADDAEVRRQVERLLRANSKMGNFLGRPAFEQLAGELTLAEETEGLEAASDVDDTPLAFLQPSTRPDSLGRMGHYEILDVLGRGGFGIVFSALDETLQRVVAVKVLAPQLASSAYARKRFLAEARSSARIRHPNVVQVYAVEDQALPYLVMEFIPGESLQQRLGRACRLNAVEVAKLGRQVAEGLAAAHKMGLIHRDVKPENILLESSSEVEPNEMHVRISDFGLARAAEDVSLTQYGIVAGTPMFMAPEQAAGESLDCRADLFSLGSVLYTCCCGQPPFQGKSTFAVLRRVVEETPPPLQELVPETPPWLVEIISRLLAKDPDDRFASAKEVADLLGCHLAQPPASEETRQASDVVPLAPPRSSSPAGGDSSRFSATRVRLRMPLLVAATLLVVLASLVYTELTGATHWHQAAIALFSREPGSASSDRALPPDGPERVLRDAEVMEIPLEPGRYTVEVHKDGKLVSREHVAVTRDGPQADQNSPQADQSSPQADQNSPQADQSSPQVSPSKVAVEPGSSDARAVLSADEQMAAVVAQLNALNAGLDSSYEVDDPHFDLIVRASELRDISSLRALPDLKSLFIRSEKLVDLAPLQGLPLNRLALDCPNVVSLAALRNMPLSDLNLSGSFGVTDLSPLEGMPLVELTLAFTQVSDLSPLREMQLNLLNCDSTKVSDLSPLEGMPLTSLDVHNTQVSDLAVLASLPLTNLNCHNTPVRDSNLSPLKQCQGLAYLKLTRTEVTASAIDELSKALPNCQIEWDGGVIERR